MRVDIQGAPAFGYLDVELQPGDQIVTEAGSMSTMASDLTMQTSFNGGFFRAILRRVFGGESVFINRYTNSTSSPRRITLVQATPGDVKEHVLSNSEFHLQPGAFLACEPTVRLGMKFAGFTSFIAREGLFKLVLTGTGRVWFGAYGALMEKFVDGETIVDSSHLVAYDPNLKLKLQLAGGIFSSFFGGEGIVTRVIGRGKIIIQTRSISGLVGWINPKLW